HPQEELNSLRITKQNTGGEHLVRGRTCETDNLTQLVVSYLCKVFNEEKFPQGLGSKTVKSSDFQLLKLFVLNGEFIKFNNNATMCKMLREEGTILNQTMKQQTILRASHQ
ncbi:hypothetical protein PROFUN_13284, partial [Planoprotostelium fungivorum]